MKKIKMLMLLLIVSVSISAQTYSYKSHTFYSVIRTEGTITEQIARNNCGDTFTYQELAGRNYVNIDIQTPLQPGNFYLLDFGNGLNYYYLLSSNSDEHGDPDETMSLPYKIDKVQCSFKYHKFYSGIRYVSSITKQIAESNCDREYGFQELTGRNYVNLEIETPLESGKFYLLDFGDGLKYYYLLYSATNEHGDSDYDLKIPFNVEKIACDTDNDGISDDIDNCINTSNPNQNDQDNDGVGDVCDNCISTTNASQSDLDNDGIGNACDSQDNRDSDGDGIQNYQDHCPNEPGPSSNNGCPIGNADLRIETEYSTVHSDCCDVSQALSSNKTHLVNNTGNLQVQLDIKNYGNITASSSRVGLYISDDSTFSESDSKLLKTAYLSTVDINETRDASFYLSFWDLVNNGGGSTISLNYIHLVLDVNEEVGETSIGEANNVESFSLNLRDISHKSFKKKDESLAEIEDIELEPYLLEIRNLNGVLILSKMVESLEEEREVINKQKSCLYIVSSRNKTKKVFIQ